MSDFIRTVLDCLASVRRTQPRAIGKRTRAACGDEPDRAGSPVAYSELRTALKHIVEVLRTSAM